MPQHMTKWTLNPPPGIRFVNEFGSGVTIEFPTEMLDQVYMSLFQQLQQNRNFTEMMEEKRKLQSSTPVQPQPVQTQPSNGNALQMTVTPIMQPKVEGGHQQHGNEEKKQ